MHIYIKLHMYALHTYIHYTHTFSLNAKQLLTLYHLPDLIACQNLTPPNDIIHTLQTKE